MTSSLIMIKIASRSIIHNVLGEVQTDVSGNHQPVLIVYPGIMSIVAYDDMGPQSY